MKELEFLSLDIQDFKEFIGEHKINLWKYGFGVHFVSGDNQVEPRLGSNGAGKSSVWDALCWCLFGRTISGLRGTDIRTWGHTPAHALVRVMVRIDGAKALIVRSTKTNGLWIDGKVVEQATIDELLGLSYAVFPHTILLGQGEPLFFDLKSTDKMALLSETLDLDRWEERSKAAKRSADLIDRDLATNAGKRSELEQSGTDADKQAADLESRAELWDADQAKAGKADAKLLDEARKALALAAKAKGYADLALDGAETEAKGCRTQIAKLDRTIVEFASTIGAASSAAQVMIDNLADLKKTKVCPTCGQALPKGSDKHIAEKRRVLEDELETNRGLLASMQKGESAAKKQRDKAAGELRAFEDKADDARDAFTRAQAAHAEVAAKIKQLTDNAVRFAMEQNPYTELLKKARVQVRRIDRLIEELDALTHALEIKHTRVKHWVGGFKQVRLYLLQEVLEELTCVTQTLLPQIGLEDWIVEYSMEREAQSGKVLPGLNVNIFKPARDKPVKWESWSGGEGQRLRLIGAMALSEVLLRRAGVQTDLLILDEPTRHLSPEGVDEMVSFLCDRGNDYQIFYIDHQVIQTTRFGSGMHIVKDERGSRIENG